MDYVNLMITHFYQYLYLVFIYLFRKGTWDQLTTLASTYTAEAQNREVRQKFMAKVLQDGYVDNYTGVRIAFDGSRFEIRNAVVWNLIVKGERIGQAASFSEWTDL